MAKNIEMSPLSDFGDLMPLEEFISCCKCGAFIDYDGYGVYATESEESNKHVVPSQIMSNNIDRSFTHVMWFNR